MVFEIPEHINNVSITKDGVLSIKDSVNLKRIRICAGDGNISETKEIELYDSYQDNKFLNNKFILSFIIIVASAFVLLWILFLYWRSRFKTRKD